MKAFVTYYPWRPSHVAIVNLDHQHLVDIENRSWLPNIRISRRNETIDVARTPKSNRLVSDSDCFYRIFTFIPVFPPPLDNFKHDIIRCDSLS